jgi:uncharacterized protein YjaZ
MKSNLLKIKFFFPEIPSEIKDKRRFVDLLMEIMRRDKSIKYAGYLKEKDLYNDLFQHIGCKDVSSYKPISTREKEKIKKTIYTTIKKCHQFLPHPDLPIFIFIYPWFPTKDDSFLFKGVTALAAYYTIHIFIDFDSYTQESLKQTIAHEWSHLVFYRNNPQHQYTLVDHMITEGLAEVFREEIVGGKASPWASSLDKEKAQKIFKTLKQKLNTKSKKIYQKVFFGDKDYKRWTGYSIGYRLVKGFREKYPKLSWEEIMKIKPRHISSVAMNKKNKAQQ